MNKVTESASLELLFKIDTRDLTPMQVRLLRQAHTLLAQVVTAEDEAEYFEASAQLLKQAVQLIKHAQFPENCQNNIPYGEQAVEYAVEELTEALNLQGCTNLDN